MVRVAKFIVCFIWLTFGSRTMAQSGMLSLRNAAWVIENRDSLLRTLSAQQGVLLRAVCACAQGRELEAIGHLDSIEDRRRMDASLWRECRNVRFRALFQMNDYATLSAEFPRYGLFRALQSIPQMTVSAKKSAPVGFSIRPLGLGRLIVCPMVVGTQRVDALFDTGASKYCYCSVDAARRLSLKRIKATVQVDGVDGKSKPQHLALARTVTLGGAQLRNVIFVVVDDPGFSKCIGQGMPDVVLGLDVMRALGSLEVDNRAQTLRFGAADCSSPGETGTLLWSEGQLCLRCLHRGESILLLLDSGNVSSLMWHDFFSLLSASELRCGPHSQRRLVLGYGSQLELQVTAVPDIRLDFSGTQVVFPMMDVVCDRNAPVSNGATMGSLGADFFLMGEKTVIDFNLMNISKL